MGQPLGQDVGMLIRQDVVEEEPVRREGNREHDDRGAGDRTPGGTPRVPRSDGRGRLGLPPAERQDAHA
jgi:hypothetical protein